MTVGTQAPFDRLIEKVDNWAAERSGLNIFAQIGDAAYIPTSIDWVRTLEPAAFDAQFKAAEMIVAHAGMGTILGALHSSKPILVMPRLARLREQRNNHQVATAERFEGRAGVLVASDETELFSLLDDLQVAQAHDPIGPDASPQLLQAISEFLHDDRTSSIKTKLRMPGLRSIESGDYRS